MIFSGSSKFCKMLLRLALATRWNRSNRFIWSVVVAVVGGAAYATRCRPRNELLGANAAVDDADTANSRAAATTKMRL